MGMGEKQTHSMKGLSDASALNAVRESLHKSGFGVLGFDALMFPGTSLVLKTASSVKCLEMERSRLYPF